MTFDIKKKQAWKYRKATADMLWLTRSQRRVTNMQDSEKHVEAAVIFTFCLLMCGIIFVGAIATGGAKWQSKTTACSY